MQARQGCRNRMATGGDQCGIGLPIMALSLVIEVRAAIAGIEAEYPEGVCLVIFRFRKRNGGLLTHNPVIKLRG